MKPLVCLAALAVFWICVPGGRVEATDWTVFEGKSGPGAGRHIVLLAGDDEYRSEEGLPMLAKILAERHGFTCTVVFAINPADYTIDPSITTNMPGIEALDRADLCIALLRFRELPDAQMKHFVDYLHTGKPLIALRTTTHAFAYEHNKESPHANYDWRSKDWPGGFGQQVLGETWAGHHGEHGKESTHGIINEAFKDHPLLRGVGELWGPTDVYTVRKLPDGAKVLVWGQVLSGLAPTDPPVAGAKNNPLMPLVWTRDYRWENGRVSKIVATTMGSAADLQCEGLRRLLINACYWCTGLQPQAKCDVDFAGTYSPTAQGFGGFRRGINPGELKTER